MKLYQVTLKGMTYSSTGTIYGISYVVAENAEEAYQKVKSFLDMHDLGFPRERALDNIKLLAEDKQYNDTGFMLYL